MLISEGSPSSRVTTAGVFSMRTCRSLTKGSSASGARSMADRGAWIVTFSGRRFYVLDPRPSDVRIEDIAHSLSLQCRFNGHVKNFYSVAQHSVLVSERCDPADALYGLLHDASEAYIGDMSAPLKHTDEMTAFRDAERHVMN